MLESFSGAPLWFMIPLTLFSILAWWIFLKVDGEIKDDKTWYWVLLYPLFLPASAIGCLLGITTAGRMTYGKWWWSDRF